MYKLAKDPCSGKVDVVIKYLEGLRISIPFDPANTDYQQFKAQINADEAQLEDADGNLMSPEEAKAFVATLP